MLFLVPRNGRVVLQIFTIQVARICLIGSYISHRLRILLEMKLGSVDFVRMVFVDIDLTRFGKCSFFQTKFSLHQWLSYILESLRRWSKNVLYLENLCQKASIYFWIGHMPIFQIFRNHEKDNIRFGWNLPRSSGLVGTFHFGGKGKRWSADQPAYVCVWRSKYPSLKIIPWRRLGAFIAYRHSFLTHRLTSFRYGRPYRMRTPA